MLWKEIYHNYLKIINKELEKYFAETDEKNSTLIKAMKYSIFAGGKRLRPALTLGAYELFGENLHEALPYACAVEMIHTYSLIHDDLPAMDNDDYRRGQLTNHKVFGDGIAILAGDGLLNYAFEIMLKDALTQKDCKPYIHSMEVIARASGINGMIGGQIADLESENTAVEQDTLDYIHLHKTAALITASLKAGAIIGRASNTDIENMEKFGNCIGLAFQIRDDILDIIGNTEKLGKKTGSDKENNKATYPSLYGLEYSVKKVKDLTSAALSIIGQYKEKSIFLYDLCMDLSNRDF